MPDHEEAVRELPVWHDYECPSLGIKHPTGPCACGVDERIAAFEESIRASERAKYAALVEAADALREKWEEPLVDGVSHVEWYERQYQFVDLNRLTGELVRVLSRFQSKEGTNE